MYWDGLRPGIKQPATRASIQSRRPKLGMELVFIDSRPARFHDLANLRLLLRFEYNFFVEIQRGLPISCVKPLTRDNKVASDTIERQNLYVFAADIGPKLALKSAEW